jgi:hypothetical protein
MQTQPTAAFETLLDEVLANTPTAAKPPQTDLLDLVIAATTLPRPRAAVAPVVEVTWSDKQKAAILDARKRLKAIGSPIADTPVKPTKESASAFLTAAYAVLPRPTAAAPAHVPAQRSGRLTPAQRDSMRGQSVTPRQWAMLWHLRQVARENNVQVNSRLPRGCDRMQVSDMIAQLQEAIGRTVKAPEAQPGKARRCNHCGKSHCWFVENSAPGWWYIYS